jgi:hypothetical protein
MTLSLPRGLRRAIQTLSLIVVLHSAAGCVLVPFLQAFKEAGATEEDRMALLSDEVRKFNAAVVLGDKMQAGTYVDPEARARISPQFKSTDDEERIVDSKIDNVEWGEGAREATVSVKTKFYKIPVYVVNTRVEEQRWKFTHSNGWKLTDRSVREG